MATIPKGSIRLYGDTATQSKAQKSLGTAKIRLYNPQPGEIGSGKTKSGIDVSGHAFNPLNTNSQFVDPNQAFPKQNPIQFVKGVLKEVPSVVKNTFQGTGQTLKDIKADPLNIKNGQLSKNPTDVYRFGQLIIPKDTAKKAVDNAWRSIKDSVKAEATNIKTWLDRKPDIKNQNNAKGVASALKVVTGGANVVFTPVTALFEGSKDIPILGSITKIIGLPFQIGGEALAVQGSTIVDKLPISQKAKEEIKPAVTEMFALAGQILIGGKISEVAIKNLEIKFGTRDTQTIIEQATKLAEEKMAGEFPKSNPIPKEFQKDTFNSTPTQADIISQRKALPAGQGVKALPAGDTSIKYGEGFTMKDKADPAIIKEVKAKNAAVESFREATAKFNIKPTASNRIKVEKALEQIRSLDEKRPELSIETPKSVEVINTVPEKVKQVETPEAISTEKVSKASSDINKALVEKGFDLIPDEQLAKFTSITKKETIEKISQFMDKDMEVAKKAVKTGETPGDFNLADKQVLFEGMKEHAKKTNDAQLLLDLANSPIAIERSVTAQTLGASGYLKKPEDPVAKIQELAKTRKEMAAKRNKTKDIDATIKKEAAKIETKPPSKADWASFVESIKC